MKTGDKITLSNGEQATVVSGDINLYKNALIVELENHDVRVVDRETLTLRSMHVGARRLWRLTERLAVIFFKEIFIKKKELTPSF